MATCPHLSILAPTRTTSQAARKLDPGPVCRFMLFVRQQQATQKAASSTVGKGGSMDLLGWVMQGG